MVRPLLGGLFALLIASGAAASKADETAKVSKNHTPGQHIAEASFVPHWLLKATLYHAGGGGAGARDSLGCKPVPMRTVAVDPTLIPRRTILFISETVGLPLPGGGVHDGYWYASDTGGAVKGRRIDLFTGHGHDSMAPASKFNLQKLSVAKAGRFDGCPPPVRVAEAAHETQN
jgi:3D (Asp-Asp-Asp) domain-containing protein